MPSESTILTPTTTRALLERLGRRPRKQWGQNFLIDGNIVRKSLALAGVQRGESVVEIGPGLGTLTGALLKAGARVYGVEIDPVLAGHIREQFGAAEGFRLLEGDAMDHPLGLLAPDAASPVPAFRIVANLPYAISTPWLESVLNGPRLPDTMTLMLQKEAADRFNAAPGTKAFGAISVFLQSAYESRATHRVGRQCFYPAPKVDSLLLHLERRELPVGYSQKSRTLIREIFQQRRKQIGGLLRQRPGSEQAAGPWLESLAAFGLGPDSRPEQIPVAAWQQLAAMLGE